MAEEIIVNGDSAADIEITTSEENSDEATNQTIQKLMQKVSILEQEKQSLVNESQTTAVKIKQLEEAIESSESDKRALSSIAARASELETEVSRLQHDLISSLSDSQDSNNELTELKKVVEELRESEAKKSERIEVIEKERELLLKKLEENVEKLSVSERRVAELEKEVVAKEESVVRSRKAVEELQLVVTESRGEVEKAEKVKVELKSKVKALEERVGELVKELEAVKKAVQENVEERDLNVNGIENVGDDNEGKIVMGMKVHWPVIAASAGAVVMVVLVYFRHAKS
uniref:peroxisomal and mitochondrial division factor 1-like n=1 Tax=Erigeron canadensis TaxID=72917 RepID=UPI001CB997CA|nr:peroxisomal and mitochondrial division factor 1-like [Erigeron canadensis]